MDLVIIIIVLKMEHFNLHFFFHNRSNARRDQLGPYHLCDTSWFGSKPQNPLAVGQYVNNRPKKLPANVAYQEVDIPLSSIVPNLWTYLPNVWYGSGNLSTENSFYFTHALKTRSKVIR